jgi:DNA-directed RNA polymerase subunit beta'
LVEASDSIDDDGLSKISDVMAAKLSKESFNSMAWLTRCAGTLAAQIRQLAGMRGLMAKPDARSLKRRSPLTSGAVGSAVPSSRTVVLVRVLRIRR